MKEKLTNAEYAVLGLLVEKPAHGYDLEKCIDERGMREWTELAFSSIYYVLKRLEGYGLISAAGLENSGKRKRKTFMPTEQGYAFHSRTTLQYLSEPHPLYPAILLGLANWPVLENAQACDALRQRVTALEKVQSKLTNTNPQHPDFVRAMFDFSLSQIQTEIEWIKRTLINLEKAP